MFAFSCKAKIKVVFHTYIYTAATFSEKKIRKQDLYFGVSNKQTCVFILFQKKNMICAFSLDTVCLFLQDYVFFSKFLEKKIKIIVQYLSILRKNRLIFLVVFDNLHRYMIISCSLITHLQSMNLLSRLQLHTHRICTKVESYFFPKRILRKNTSGNRQIGTYLQCWNGLKDIVLKSFNSISSQTKAIKVMKAIKVF